MDGHGNQDSHIPYRRMLLPDSPTNFVSCFLVSNLIPPSTVIVFLDKATTRTVLPNLFNNLGNDFRLFVFGLHSEVSKSMAFNEQSKFLVPSCDVSIHYNKELCIGKRKLDKCRKRGRKTNYL